MHPRGRQPDPVERRPIGSTARVVPTLATPAMATTRRTAVPRTPATDEVRAHHRLGALSEAQIVAADDATTVGVDSRDRAQPVDVDLPSGWDRGPDVTLTDALGRRRTRRDPPDEPLEADALAWLLTHAARATDDGRRPHPSAGASYPLVLDVVALRCDGVPAGVHRYAPSANGLHTVAIGDRTAAVRAAFGRDWVQHARAVLVLSADVAAATQHHAVRGYRYALLEAGHLAQNLLLLAAAADLPACPLGGFADATLHEVVEGSEGEVVLYAVVL